MRQIELGRYKPTLRGNHKVDDSAFLRIKPLTLSHRAQQSDSVVGHIDNVLADYAGTSAVKPQSPIVAEAPTTQLSFSGKLARARTDFAEQKGRRKMVAAYEVEQDVALYKVLAGEKSTSGYEKAKRDLDAYIDIQLQTHLGERLNVGMSSIRHNIVNGELRIADTDESLLEIIKRGQQYRRKHGKEVDWDRELAEVVGFGRIQKTLVDPKAPIGTKMFFVSQPGDVENGSIYKKNFYDVHEKISETEVVSTRYTSGLTPEESHQRLSLVDSRFAQKAFSTDSEKLANPIEVASGMKGLETSYAIHDFMHINHPHMSRQKFTVIMEACKLLRDDYKESLINDPDNVFEHKRRLDILMNYADNVAAELESIPEGKVVALHDPKGTGVLPWIPPQIDKSALALQQVRIAETGCGSSGGSSSFSPFSVAESAPNKDGKNCSTCNKPSADDHYHCPSCTKTYASERLKDGNDRTKKCNCGFVFNC